MRDIPLVSFKYGISSKRLLLFYSFHLSYLGYKGVVALHPKLDEAKKEFIQFRSSMRKFNATLDPTFAVLDYSKPYNFGRLNNDMVVLLASLGVSSERLLEKQEEYFDWLSQASTNVTKALDLSSCVGRYELAERVLLEGIDSPAVIKEIHAIQMQEIKSFEKNGKTRVRMMIHKSRLLFGICDPFRVLKEGEVFVRVIEGRKGATTLTNIDVLVTRNPCLHPGTRLGNDCPYSS